MDLLEAGFHCWETSLSEPSFSWFASGVNDIPETRTYGFLDYQAWSFLPALDRICILNTYVRLDHLRSKMLLLRLAELEQAKPQISDPHLYAF